MSPEPIRAVFLDIGETLFHRTREYAAWAEWFGVPAHTFSAVFGAVVARGGTVTDVLRHFRPEADHAALRARMRTEIDLPALGEADLYPGARAALTRLQERGWFVGIAGNQPWEIGDQVRALDLPADRVAVSAEIGWAKPAPEFFAALLGWADCPAAQAVYVGDQLDDDVGGALRAGLGVVRVRTGPWGQLTHDAELEARCRAVVASVAEVPDVLPRSVGSAGQIDELD